MELISIIIPVYNVEQYLDDCIRSVQTQTYQNIEIILVDDGSTDGTLAVLKKYAKSLAEEKGLMHEFNLYDKVETLAADLISHQRNTFKPVCANVDFYSGFVYTMLGIPEELFTPMFAISRISGWCAHRLEELVNKGKIIRPAYKAVKRKQDYIPLDERQ